MPATIGRYACHAVQADFPRHRPFVIWRQNACTAAADDAKILRAKHIAFDHRHHPERSQYRRREMLIARMRRERMFIYRRMQRFPHRKPSRSQNLAPACCDREQRSPTISSLVRRTVPGASECKPQRAPVVASANARTVKKDIWAITENYMALSS